LMPCGTRSSHARQWRTPSRGKYREVPAELMSGDQISTPKQGSQRLVGCADQIPGLVSILNIGRSVPERALVQAGHSATLRKTEPDGGVAERDVAAPDSVVLRPLDIHGRYQQGSGWTRGHCGGTGQVTADKHSGLHGPWAWPRPGVTQVWSL